MDTVDPREVLDEYTDILNETRDSLIVDASQLPIPKGIIRQVLVEAIKLFQDTELQEQLKAMFIRLADFQDLSAVERKALAALAKCGPTGLSESNLGNHASQMSELGDDLKSLLSRHSQELNEFKLQLDALSGAKDTGRNGQDSDAYQKFLSD